MNSYQVLPLVWEEEYFGIKSCKVILQREITNNNLDEIKNIVKKYRFVTVQNNNNIPKNNVLLGKSGFYLMDVNLQLILRKNSFSIRNKGNRIDDVEEFSSSSEKDYNSVVNMIKNSFKYSRFFDEEKFPENRKNIYVEWFKNALFDTNKIIEITRENGEVDSLIIYRIDFDSIIIELICSSTKGKSSPDSCVKCYTMFLPFLLIKIDVFS